MYHQEKCQSANQENQSANQKNQSIDDHHSNHVHSKRNRHQNHPKAKDDMKLQSHDFQKDKPATLVIVDSLISNYRKEFEGRGELSDRQTKLKTHIKHLVRTAETRNVVCLITNSSIRSLEFSSVMII